MSDKFKNPNDVENEFLEKFPPTDKQKATKNTLIKSMLASIATSGLIKTQKERYEDQSEESKQFHIKRAELRRKLKVAKKEKNSLAITNIKATLTMLENDYISKK